MAPFQFHFIEVRFVDEVVVGGSSAAAAGDSVTARTSEGAIARVLGMFKPIERESRGARVLWAAFEDRDHGAMRIARRAVHQERPHAGWEVANVCAHTI